MSKRLYRVDIETAYYVLADSESEARSHAGSALADTTVADVITGVTVHRSGEPIANEWDLDSLVYGDHDHDITLAEAMEVSDE